MAPYLRIHRKRRIQRKSTHFGWWEIRRNQATIALANFFAYVIAGSIGFQRVAVVAIGRFERGPSMIGECVLFGYFSNF